MKRNLYSSIAVIVFLFHGFLLSGQTESLNVNGFKTTNVTKRIEDISVVISQRKSLNHTDPLCTANIRIFRNDIQIDSLNISDDQFDAVGDNYGLLIYEKLILNHVVISKYGSSDGKTIIVNNRGQKFITIGGFSSLDAQDSLLFSGYHSDISGFSVFDLKMDREIYSILMDDDRVRAFFRFDNRYFVKSDQNDSNYRKFWEIDLVNKRLSETSLNVDSLGICLDKLANYKGIIISCE